MFLMQVRSDRMQGKCAITVSECQKLHTLKQAEKGHLLRRFVPLGIGLWSRYYSSLAKELYCMSESSIVLLVFLADEKVCKKR